RRRRRLLRLMTRRYRSLRSDVAKRPPSSGTSGRRSGGITGTIVSIIHSGLLPLSRNASTTLRRFAIFLRFASLVISRISARRVSASDTMSRPPGFCWVFAASNPARAVWTALPGEDWPARLVELCQAALSGGRGGLVVVPDGRDLDRL